MATASIPPAARTDAGLRRRRLVGHRIRQARHRLGASQEWLAVQIDTDRRAVSAWERGHWTPNALHLEQLAEALGEPVHYFYGGPSAHPQPPELDPDVGNT